MNQKIAVIADDFTGANDTGVQFAKQGLETVVLLGQDRHKRDPGAQIVVTDTQSRALSPREAYQNTLRAASLFTGGDRILYKKVDSTLRGNPGLEIKAVMDAFGLKLAIVAPSFPKLGRTCVGGYVLIQGAPVESTEIAHDPKCPVEESHLPTLLSRQTGEGAGHAGIKEIMSGAEGLAACLRANMEAGRGIVVCDAWREEHFPLILKAGMRLGVPVLWVGSAGLAEHLPAALGMRTSAPDPAPVLVVAGSVSAVTRMQTAHLRTRPGMLVVDVDAGELLEDYARDAEIARVVGLAAKAAAEGLDVLVVSGRDQDVVNAVRARAKDMGKSSIWAADEVAKGLGAVCRRLFLECSFCGMALTGGDTAVSCCAALGATRFRVVSEVAAGIPIGELCGGEADGMKVVTKAGAFGAVDALALAVDALKARTSWGVNA